MADRTSKRISSVLQAVLLGVLATTLLIVAANGVAARMSSSDAGSDSARVAQWAVSMTGGPDHISLDGNTDTPAVYTYSIDRTAETASQCTDIVLRLDRALPEGVSVSLYAENNADPTKNITVTDPTPTSVGQVYTFHIGDVGYSDSLSGGIHGTLTFSKNIAVQGSADVALTLEAITSQVN